MKDWKKAVLWVVVGFCLVSVLGSIFSLGAFLQMASINIYNLSIGNKLKSFFIDVTTWTLVGAVVSVALIVTATIYSATSKKLKLLGLILAVLIITFVISIFFIVFSYCILPYIDYYNNRYYAFSSSYHQMYYESFFHFQSYLSATVSLFFPMLIAGGLIFGYLICKAKQQKREKIVETTDTETAKIDN